MVQRQGEARLTDPWPGSPEAFGQTPQILSGVVARTARFAVALQGRRGPLELQGAVGVQHVWNAGHLQGAHETVMTGRLQALLWWGRTGILRD